jgi:uncharacterized phage-associated protein
MRFAGPVRPRCYKLAETEDGEMGGYQAGRVSWRSISRPGLTGMIFYKARVCSRQQTRPFMPFSFSHRKATQALNFLARQAGGSINKMKALKLVYFADRYHLRRFARPIIGDEYLAMNYGPVPSGTKDLAEMSDFLGEEEASYAKAFLRPVDRFTFGSEQPVVETVFSQSDRKALAWAWQRFGMEDGFTLAKLTHLYPEWKRHEASLNAKLTTRAPMNYRDFLDDPPAGCEPCYPLTDEERNAVAAGIDEVADFERCWR